MTNPNPQQRCYNISAYDVDHNRLYLTGGDDSGVIYVATATEVIKTYTRKTGRVIDTETGTPANNRRRIAYFRCGYFGRCVEIHVNTLARTHGLRNYQMRRNIDTAVNFCGAPALNDGPRFIPGQLGGTVHLVQGEGDPFRVNNYGDDVTWFGTMTRATVDECGWSGWTLETPDDEIKIHSVSRIEAGRALTALAGINVMDATGGRRS